MRRRRSNRPVGRAEARKGADLPSSRRTCAAGRPSPHTIQGFNMPHRLVLSAAIAPGDKFDIAVFAINGPISAAPANFLWFREAKIEFFR
jgi:hypothetical protein